ncbi:unnamed protein product [Cuscuta campestris]|uniref:Uncharacterized protein n=1 Tax=Cuscuta campestris TaxID=132261 RepID=A0A484MD26_9ASTE|nr:unnamed protein product [Cuscuta campestris]
MNLAKAFFELVEESIVETGYLIAEIDKESIVKDDDELVEIDEFHCRMPNEEEEKHLLRRIDERLLFELGLKWIVYRLMVIHWDREDMIVDVVGECHDVSTTLVGMFLCVKEQFWYDKRDVHSMEMRMRNLPVSGLLHEVYVYGRNAPKMVASYEGGKEMLCREHLYYSMPFISVHFPVEYADVLTREDGKFINSVRGPPDAGLEVRLEECVSGTNRTMNLIIFEKSLSAARDAMETVVKKVRELGDPRALKLADVLGGWWFEGHGSAYFSGMCLTDDERDEDDYWFAGQLLLARKRSAGWPPSLMAGG